MDISMTGIDFQKAGISNRELFSFTKSSAIQAVQKALVLSGADGCILLSTCNRTELWLSGSPALSPYLTLCRLKGIQPERYASLFVHRFSNQAIRHLFELSCGLKSQIFGEDQIITQVKQALFLSREAGCTGTVLEKLFQYAITASKRVKSEVFFLFHSSLYRFQRYLSASGKKRQPIRPALPRDWQRRNRETNGPPSFGRRLPSFHYPAPISFCTHRNAGRMQYNSLRGSLSGAFPHTGSHQRHFKPSLHIKKRRRPSLFTAIVLSFSGLGRPQGH